MPDTPPPAAPSPDFDTPLAADEAFVNYCDGRPNYLYLDADGARSSATNGHDVRRVRLSVPAVAPEGREAERPSPEQLRKMHEVIRWNAREDLHPLTCGNDSGHASLVPVPMADGTVHLACVDCSYFQPHIPEVVFASMLKEPPPIPPSGGVSEADLERAVAASLRYEFGDEAPFLVPHPQTHRVRLVEHARENVRIILTAALGGGHP